MTNKDLDLLHPNLTFEQRKFINKRQNDCKVCKCYGIENCGKDAETFRKITKQSK